MITVLVRETFQKVRNCLYYTLFTVTCSNIDRVRRNLVSFIKERMIASYPELEEFLQSTRLEEIMDNFSVYIKTKSTSNHTMAYWLLYIEMVQVLLLFIRATRENDWQLHLSAVRSMLPWFFAADRVNYARYGSIYWLEMISIDKTHPGKTKARFS